jgi:pimeloyl-ACP methyl ester carboxylesterase
MTMTQTPVPLRSLFVRGPIGESGPPVLALHGVAESGAAFVPALLRAARGHRAWAVDLRGHGASEHRPREYGIEAYVEDVLGVLETIGRPAVLVGRSLGAVVATVLAQEEHPLVAAVVVEEPPLHLLAPTPLRRLHEQVLALRATGAPPDAYEDLVTGSVLADARTTRARALHAVDPDAIAAVVDGRTLAGFVPERRLPVPSLLLRAGHDLAGELGGRDAYVDQLADFLTRQR